MTSASPDHPVVVSCDRRGVASLAFNRPQVGNAYDGAMIAALLEAIDALGSQPDVRVLVLRGIGKHFQSGADLAWVRSLSTAEAQENLRASRATAAAVDRLNRLPIPTLALVHGACFGGGTGILAACDIVLAADNALFSIAEVRWGLTAAIIVPQLRAAVGARQLRRYALSGERFDAAEARRIGLVHDVVPLAELAAAGERMIDQLLGSAPLATAQTKELLIAAPEGNLNDGSEQLIAAHAERRQSREAREGLAAFAERRSPDWRR